ncbi:MAG: pyrroline-5-carboxylate reductase [Clostridiales Family XIII bacterium]|jgi:pyrroline-5-carboxylate reductase|nr:pyrroline-5-carboxylate reductase [Clostridiales Family XIII bacterium]
MKLGILGTGNMGGAILKGFSEALDRAASEGRDADSQIYAFDADEAKLAATAALPFVTPVGSLTELAVNADFLLIALKPNIFDTVIPEVAAAAKAAGGGKVYISIAAGISIGWLASVLGADAKIIRVMPNTPAMVGAGMAGLSRSESVSDLEFQQALGIFGSIGRAVEVPESAMDAVVGVSGSSPAYAYMYMQALIECAVEAGIPEAEARIFAAQSTLGAAKMVLENTDSPEQLRINVCSPGGTTIEAVNLFLEKDFMGLVKEGMNAAIAKSEKMTK